MKFVHNLFLLTLSITALYSCGDEGLDINTEDPNGDELVIVSNASLDSAQALTTKINGKIFSIPSPLQMVSLIKSQDNVFNESVLTNAGKVENFTTTFQRAINMGVYGADLGYAAIYEKNLQAVSYLNSIEKLSKDLGISGAFDKDLVDRFIENGNNQDSILVIVSEGYRKGDQYLKDNEQHDVASLILTGGWIESMFFATISFEKTKDQEIANRIGEQKTALKTIIDLLADFNTEGTYTELIADLKDVQVDFDQIKFNYTFIAPVTDPNKGLTTIKSKSSVEINTAVLNNIVQKIKVIRNKLIV